MGRFERVVVVLSFRMEGEAMAAQSMYFEICPECRNHGRVVFPNGDRSDEVLSQGNAVEMVQYLWASGKLSGDDFNRIFRQIRESGLPLMISSDVLDLVEVEVEVEDVLRNNPIVHPIGPWRGARTPVVSIEDEVCFFCQEMLADSRPLLQ